MCGFVGFTNKIGDDGLILEPMMNRIAHRGPDSSGKYIDQNVAMGFRRLSIIDIEGGNQPMLNEDGSLVLTFNGEIYNYLELKEKLIGLGHSFKSDADSEVLLHGFEEWGGDMLSYLRGMYAFVIYNRDDNSLFGARDIFGIKPFYYALMEDCFMYSSEIKAFLDHPQFKKELNEEALGHYLSFQYSPIEETFFKNVYKLPPAHFFTYKDGAFQKTRYFTPEFQEVKGAIDFYSDLIEDVMEDSVAAHKIADVEVGSFLSSGIDSSYIAALAQVDKTYTVGFEGHDGKYSEIPYAEAFAKEMNLKNKSKIISSKEYFDELPHIQYHMDEPLADPAAIALYFVSREASRDVKVVMSGEGADELFCGYKIYQEPITLTPYDRLPFGLRKAVSAVCYLLPKKRGINYLIRRGKKIEERYIGNAEIFSYPERNKLLKSEKAKNALPPYEVCQKFYSDVKHQDDVTKMQYLDINMWLMGDILLKADKTSMANSLELRVPFLDKQVFEVARHLPLNCRIDTGSTKLSLRKAAARKIPISAASKPKLGFPVPIREWLKEEEYYNLLKASFSSAVAEQFFDTARLVKMLDRHFSGKADLSRRIWTVYTFLVWYNEFFIKI